MSVDKSKNSDDFEADFYEDSIFESALTLAYASKVRFVDYVRLLWYVVGYRHYRKRHNI